jgi:1-acyl-sn-glycerol-3-phosphate acyltransferase
MLKIADPMWLSKIFIGLVKILIGASPRWFGSVPSPTQRIYFANHSSHLDTIAIWSALPPDLRTNTRPVAAADYWNRGTVRKFIASKVLNVVFIERIKSKAKADPLQPLMNALSEGNSLIIFPEGTRNEQALPNQFKAGLFHLAEHFPNVELIPVYLENLHRCMPKGTFFPVPLICTVRFGKKLVRNTDESKVVFLERARNAVMELA